MKNRFSFTWVIVLLLAALFVSTSSAYVLLGPSWQNSQTTFYVRWDGGQYDTAFIQAMNKWNGRSNFSFSSNTSSFVDPCSSVSWPDYLNGYRFSSNDCGRGWGTGALAVAWYWYSGSRLLDTDIIFNSNYPWGVHDGTTTSPYDFRRVAVHELGHALGLGHETTNTAIMNPSYSNLRTITDPQTDDINGLIAIYGGGSFGCSGRCISLRAYNGQYVVAERGGGDLVYANRNAIGPWEEFERIDLGNNKVALQAYNGQYVVAEGGGGGLVYANRNAIGPWEEFELIDLGNNKVALQAYNGQYVVAAGGGGGLVYANSNSIGLFETFEKIERISSLP